MNAEQQQARKEMLQGWYDQGYRYMTATNLEDLLVGTYCKEKIEAFGVWQLENAERIVYIGGDPALFPDVKWANETPLDIEEELKKPIRFDA